MMQIRTQISLRGSTAYIVRQIFSTPPIYFHISPASVICIKAAEGRNSGIDGALLAALSFLELLPPDEHKQMLAI